MPHTQKNIQKIDKPRANKRKKEDYTSAQDEVSRWLARRIREALKAPPSTDPVSQHH